MVEDISADASSATAPQQIGGTNSKSSSNSLGIAGFALSILSVILFPLGFFLGIIALILSIIQYRRNKSGLAIAGIVISIFGILIGGSSLFVTIIWFFTVPMINDQLDSGTACLDAMSQFAILNTGKTCYDSVASTVNVEVSHGSRELEVTGIKILIFDDSCFSESDVYSGIPGVNGQSVFTVSTPCASASRVSIAPIIGEIQCDALSRVQLREC